MGFVEIRVTLVPQPHMVKEGNHAYYYYYYYYVS